MVVADPILVQSRGPYGLNSLDQSVLDEKTQSVVHGLPRDRADVAFHRLGDMIRSAMGLVGDRPQDSKTLWRDVQTAITKERRKLSHCLENNQVWTLSKIGKM